MRFVRRHSFGFLLGVALTLIAVWLQPRLRNDSRPSAARMPDLAPRQPIDTSGFSVVVASAGTWQPNASLPEIARGWENAAERAITNIDHELASSQKNWRQDVPLLVNKASCLMAAGKPEKAYAVLLEARALAERGGSFARESTLATLMYFQGVAGLRLGENENCIMCRGESSCILPIGPAAVHQNPAGSRLAIIHFTEYLEAFPDDLEVRWLLNVAHMTLGEHPRRVDPRYLVSLERYESASASIGKFRDIGALVGVNRLNMAGGAIMEDFDNDGRLDLVTTSLDFLHPMTFYRNRGDGRFEDHAAEAGISNQVGGFNCVQTDYNNDGRMDIFITRGAWLPPMRPTLLRNDGNGRFADVTAEAGLLAPLSSNAAQWADYDNDGWLDLFICCEARGNVLYRNDGDGAFSDVTEPAGIASDGGVFAKGCAWIDYDNDDYPDLFVNNLLDTAQLYRNNRNGGFTRVTRELGVDGPFAGFSCWAWDYDNDGWLDIFATSYDRTLGDVVKGLIGEQHGRHSNKLFRNQEGKGFNDVTREAGLDMVFATMGSNFGDFDNDGYLDMYLGTGEPGLATLVPNRMFKNVAGKRFAEITASAGVGSLQKGHGVACGDWDRDGNIDIFIEMGGVIEGDKYHNILFQNPGHAHSWLTLKLVGKKTNRAALGARIKVVTAGDEPMTIHRHVSSGSSFGANPLEQTIGLANANRIATLEIHWPTSGTTQVFRDLDVNQAVEVTEFAESYKKLDWKRIPLP